MDLSLKGKVALVGGASQGIGYAIARLLAAEGARVAMVARKEEALEGAARRITTETGGEALPISADIRRADDCVRIVESALARFGRVDVLVNNDGAPPLGKLESFDDAAWSRAVEQNLMSVVRLSRGVLPGMRERRWGRIVNIAALSVLQPIPQFGLSVATWAGVIGYAKTLSIEVATEGVTVHTICPGRIATPRLGTVFGGGRPGAVDDDKLAEMTRQIPMQRIGLPDEIAGLVGFLASPWSAYMTGCVFHVDGGRRAGVL
ncbi:MAG: SDR family oxidoreductase [Burkholderiaceae bacterium]